jgi:hypothetical protein
MAEETKKTEHVKEKPLEKMTAPELREIAKEIEGVTGVHAMKKEELLKIIKQARGIVDEKPVKKEKIKVILTVVDLKKKILALKAEKAAAHEARDVKKIEILRRRINRFKKRSRKVKVVAQAA